MKIIIDAMGGDNAPAEIIKGAAQAVAEYNVELVFVGNSTQITAVAQEIGFDLTPHSVVHTDVAVTMDDDAMVVLHAKKESSLCVGLRMLAAGEGDAFVSATNTAALFTAASLIVRKIPGIQRAAIGSVLPMKPPVLLLDSGANIIVNDDYLEQFAIMGSAYVRSVNNIERPRVGLLNNGEEPTKGTQLQIDTYARLAANGDINFVGNVEANKIPFDICDVIVADGFAGNVLLKTVEGMGKLLLTTFKDMFYANVRTKAAGMLIMDKIDLVKKEFDPAEYGGAPLLGLKMPVIKAHGSSKAKAFKNAIRQAMEYAQSNVVAETTTEIKRITDERKKAAEQQSVETVEPILEEIK